MRGEPLTVNACELEPSCVVAWVMTDGGVATAFERAERALDRIEQALERRRGQPRTDEQLREKVREAIVELDDLIRAAG